MDGKTNVSIFACFNPRDGDELKRRAEDYSMRKFGCSYTSLYTGTLDDEMLEKRKRLLEGISDDKDVFYPAFIILEGPWLVDFPGIYEGEVEGDMGDYTLAPAYSGHTFDHITGPFRPPDDLGASLRLFFRKKGSEPDYDDTYAPICTGINLKVMKNEKYEHLSVGGIVPREIPTDTLHGMQKQAEDYKRKVSSFKSYRDGILELNSDAHGVGSSMLNVLNLDSTFSGKVTRSHIQNVFG